MHALRHEITLPAGYDVGIIHARVATKGAVHRTGLGFTVGSLPTTSRAATGSQARRDRP
ncbi:hypothetical protein FHS29_000641 [Saccharothrix tamanrassetensis]|uniref:Uncharacterized protein n=1 Tax=Saccharothrix tamanrassetensis TaxID=1051531 RepID=A0A841CA62_9PSEU|nr:DUF4865 family protein [Saccharothrix tamanrassetensis]MBB5954071.1 hypothetical protein [Saccharothrix tamanrassetensis]